MNLLDFYLPEEILVAISFLVVLFVIKRILWKPLMKIIDERQKGVDDMLQRADDAEKAVAEMEERRLKQDAEMERLASEKMNEARELASREYDRIIADAEEKARKLEEAGEEKGRRAFEQCMNESQEAIIELAMGAASIIVESSMDSEKNRELIESMLQRVQLPSP